jgi:surface glycoprotein (TIGR04207 family)/PGF-CTERM protein
MTGNTNKARAVFLAALMVFSVFAGTVAFSGSAAAQTVSDGSVSNSTVVEETTNDHKIIVNATGVDSATGSNVTVTFPEGTDLTAGAGVTDLSANSDTSIGTTFFNITSQNNVTISVGGTGSGGSGTLNVEFRVGATAPDTSGDTSVDVNAVLDEDVTSGNDVNDQLGIETFTIQEADDGALQSAVHYNDDADTAGGTSGGEGIGFEVVFEEPVDLPGGDDNAIFIANDEAEVADLTDVTNGPSTGSNDVERLFFQTGTTFKGDLELVIEDTVVTKDNEAVTDEGNNSITFAAETLTYDETGLNAYQGSNVAIVANASNRFDTSVVIEGDGNDYFFDGSTGPNSEVLVLNTTNRALSDYNVSIGGSDDRDTQVTNRDLGFGLTIDDLNVTDEDTIEVDLTADAGSRDVEVELLDSSGDDIATDTITSGGDGTATVEFDTASADDGDALEEGEYTVEATDLDTGITRESSQISVSQADDDSAAFTENAIVEERGDIFETTIELTETDEATISFGSQDSGVLANATVEDDDGDDQVTVQINTFNLQNGDDIYRLPDDSDDIINDRESNGARGSPLNQLSDLIDSGSYDLEVEANTPANGASDGVTNSDDVATVTLNERSTESIRMWTGSSDEVSPVNDLEDVNEAIAAGQITQSSEIAVGDLAVHQIQASGFEGALDARQTEDVSSTFGDLAETSGPFNLTIEEASPGANQDASEVKLDYDGGDANVSVIADGPNDTYFVVVDTGAVNFDGPRNEQLPSDEDNTLETNFTVINNDAGFDFTSSDLDDDENAETFVEFTAAEPDVTINEPFNVSQASAQTISAETNIAPGTEVNLRVRSQDGVSPSFLKTADPVIQPDGTFSATFDFSQQNVGDEYDIIVQDPIRSEDEEEEGQVVGAVATDTATPEPDTDTATPEPDTATPEPDTATPEPDTATPEPDTDTPTSTPTSTPGFGVVVALTALLAAALLAVRRD